MYEVVHYKFWVYVTVVNSCAREILRSPPISIIFETNYQPVFKQIF